ncbi:hypothetical protein Psal006b_01519 [Piscirickettsia salmonis]|uniref:Uncharacterized protein n=1 Tax=Piscirickettsia salmonis TaxID=1238 RepID=A0AAC8VI80_PISSA|nr:hypothetical protein KU39_1689 [Piscirickettsia salmonis]QGN98526.1 hypothetical protein Psal006b_01519 [Piscirickettsia salmonis]QGO02145.1 hypothetical protein Psal008_01532 [Piscirickettsia salmonis]QGO12834.1 hypothetical protein Psal010b_01517 [Piscirickettsia salmonis]QGO19876.1 hypothetical protein Psal013_01529 [Piscirickettsia salmonis]
MSIDHWDAEHYHQSSDMQYHIALDILADEHFNTDDICSGLIKLDTSQ